MAYGTCTQCGCTDNNCRQCIEATGQPCFWVDNTHELCSACVPETECDPSFTSEEVFDLLKTASEIKNPKPEKQISMLLSGENLERYNNFYNKKKK